MWKIFLLVLYFSVVSYGESATVFESDFAILPSGWANDNWSYSYANGAYVHINMPGGGSPQIYTYSAHMSSNSSSAVWYFVPDGTDSLVIDVEQSIDVFTSVSGDFYIRLLYSDLTEEDVFHVQITMDDYSYVSTDPVHYVITDPPGGTWIGFEIHAFNTLYYMSTGHIYWYITHLSAKAYGESLDLDTVTWASIKTSL